MNITQPIDFHKIAAETGVRKGNIFHSPYWGWVVSGHPDIDLICIDPPHEIGDKIEGRKVKSVKIKNDCWVFELEKK